MSAKLNGAVLDDDAGELAEVVTDEEGGGEAGAVLDVAWVGVSSARPSPVTTVPPE